MSTGVVRKNGHEQRMVRRLTLFLAPLTVSMSLASHVQAGPDGPVELQADGHDRHLSWSDRAVLDIERAHELVTLVHPAVLDPGDRAFQAWFSNGHRLSMAKARQADSEAKARAALRFYTAGYEDGHLIAWKRESEPAQSRWAGWTVQYRNGQYRVVRRADNWSKDVPENGDTLLRCDGRDVDAILADQVAPYVDRRMTLDSVRTRLAWQLTHEESGDALWEPLRLAECTVRTAQGALRDYPLVWRDATDDKEGARGPRPVQGISRLPSGTYWINASNFMLQEGDVASFQDLLQRIRRLDKANAVVLDARGNSGGSSLVGVRILRALLKNSFPDDESHARAFWRVSDPARDALKVYEQMVARAEGTESWTYRALTEISNLLEAAASRGDAFFEQRVPDADPEPEEEGAPFNGKLVLVTDAWCASACLDFADAVRSIPGAVHAGHATSGDTPYIDVLEKPLPSGMQMWVPMKVWRNRPRGSNEPLVPAHSFDGDIEDTPALQKWVEQDVLPRVGRLKA